METKTPGREKNGPESLSGQEFENLQKEKKGKDVGKLDSRVKRKIVKP
jgi:hypothetical protein